MSLLLLKVHHLNCKGLLNLLSKVFPQAGLNVWNKGLCALSFSVLRIAERQEISPERKYSCQTDSGSYSPELPASVGNVSEITVAGLMGVNTVADGEACAAKGVQYRGKCWLRLATLSSSVVYGLHYRARESLHQEITLMSKSSEWCYFVICLFWNNGWEGKTPKCCLHE